MEPAMYTVGLTHDAVNISPLSYEKRLATLAEVWEHCVFIAEQLGLELPLDKQSLCVGVQEQEGKGAFVTIDFPDADITQQLAIIFERGEAERSPKPRLRARFLSRR